MAGLESLTHRAPPPPAAARAAGLIIAERVLATALRLFGWEVLDAAYLEHLEWAAEETRYELVGHAFLRPEVYNQ